MASLLPLLLLQKQVSSPSSHLSKGRFNHVHLRCTFRIMSCYFTTSVSNVFRTVLPLVACNVNGYVPGAVGDVLPLLPHPLMPLRTTSATTHPNIVCRSRARCKRAIAKAVAKSIRSHLKLAEPLGSGPANPAAAAPAIVVTVTVTRVWLDPSRVTEGELKEHSIPRGAPMQASETVPRNSPVGVTASA